MPKIRRWVGLTSLHLPTSPCPQSSSNCFRAWDQREGSECPLTLSPQENTTFYHEDTGIKEACSTALGNWLVSGKVETEALPLVLGEGGGKNLSSLLQVGTSRPRNLVKLY